MRPPRVLSIYANGGTSLAFIWRVRIEPLSGKPEMKDNELAEMKEEVLRRLRENRVQRHEVLSNSVESRKFYDQTLLEHYVEYIFNVLLAGEWNPADFKRDRPEHAPKVDQRDEYVVQSWSGQTLSQPPPSPITAEIHQQVLRELNNEKVSYLRKLFGH